MPLNDLFDYLKVSPNGNTAVDLAHGVLLAGTLLSYKPMNILELGVGTGYCTFVAIHCIEYNKIGKLTCVDNWWDYSGREPNWAETLKNEGVSVIASNEKNFLSHCRDYQYDFLISDADHFTDSID